MKFQFINYIIPLVFSSVIVLGLALYGYKYRSVKGAKAFAFSMLIGFLWAFANALEMAGVDLSTKLFWANLQYIFYAFAPVAWLIMTFEFTGKQKMVTKKNIILLSIIPLITIILVMTNHYHGLIRYNVQLDNSGAFSVIYKEYGPWFIVHAAYSYLLNIYILFLLFRAAWRRNVIYQKQTAFLLLGFAVLFVSNLLYITGLGPIRRFDISPVLFSLSGLIMWWGIFHFRIFDLVPIARTTIIEEMGSGIIVIDRKDRLIDINPHAKNMLIVNEKEIKVGALLEDVSSKLASIILNRSSQGIYQTEFNYANKDGAAYYEVYVSPIHDYRKENVAWVLIINDITDLKDAREQIYLQQQELAVMDERERMARDLHDNLGQILSFSNVQIQAIRQQVKKGNLELVDSYLIRLNDIIRDAHKDIREYVYNIRDNNRYKGNFLELLEEQVEEFRSHSGIEVNIAYTEEEKEDENNLGTEEKIQLLNISKEALNNVMKHAEADIINISFEYMKNGLKLMIMDNGKGFNNKRNTGSGLSIMNERARLIGGRFRVESQSGVGTSVMVYIPISGGNNSENIDSR